MNITELKKQRDEIDAQIKVLESSVVVGAVVKHRDYWSIEQDFYGVFLVIKRNSCGEERKGFLTEQAAKRFADAMNVMFELRMCDGYRGFIYGENNWSLGLDDAGNWQSLPETCLLGCFDSEASALAARAKVGCERIKNAIKALSGCV